MFLSKGLENTTPVQPAIKRVPSLFSVVKANLSIREKRQQHLGLEKKFDFYFHTSQWLQFMIGLCKSQDHPMSNLQLLWSCCITVVCLGPADCILFFNHIFCVCFFSLNCLILYVCVCTCYTVIFPSNDIGVSRCKSKMYICLLIENFS